MTQTYFENPCASHLEINIQTQTFQNLSPAAQKLMLPYTVIAVTLMADYISIVRSLMKLTVKMFTL